MNTTLDNTITEREIDLMKYIIRFKEVNGYSPTIREIQKGINSNSTQHITYMLDDLMEKGYLTFQKKKPRTIRILRFIV